MTAPLKWVALSEDAVDPDADWGLPAWTYSDPEFFAAELERIIRPSWQVVCHVNEVLNPGAYRTVEILGESIIVIRGEDRQLRAFTNVCRHRAMRLVAGPAGCARKLVCPYHAWTYESDGRLSGVPMKADYPALRLEENRPETNLAPVALEIWHGFVFVRLADGGFPSVAEMLAPAEAELAPFRLAEMEPLGQPSVRPRAVNWKNVGDNYSDNLHIPVAHDGLTRLFGKSYAISAHGWADRMSGELDDGQDTKNRGGNFWEEFYRRHLPRSPHLPEGYQRRWFYWKLWPNMALDIYPDQIDFMQWLPTGPETCELRVAAYALPDARREMRLVRYANDRINRVVNTEDTALIESVQRGMASRSFTAGPLAASEVCLRSFTSKVRAILPEARQARPPVAGWSKVVS